MHAITYVFKRFNTSVKHGIMFLKSISFENIERKYIYKEAPYNFFVIKIFVVFSLCEIIFCLFLKMNLFIFVINKILKTSL